MKKHLPWYDSEWLGSYSKAQEIIKKNNPKKLKSFIETLEPLQTRKDFEVIKLKNFLSQEILDESKELINNLETHQKETPRVFPSGVFGRA